MNDSIPFSSDNKLENVSEKDEDLSEERHLDNKRKYYGLETTKITILPPKNLDDEKIKQIEKAYEDKFNNLKKEYEDKLKEIEKSKKEKPEEEEEIEEEETEKITPRIKKKLEIIIEAKKKKLSSEKEEKEKEKEEEKEEEEEKREIKKPKLEIIIEATKKKSPIKKEKEQYIIEANSLQINGEEIETEEIGVQVPEDNEKEYHHSHIKSFDSNSMKITHSDDYISPQEIKIHISQLSQSLGKEQEVKIIKERRKRTKSVKNINKKVQDKGTQYSPPLIREQKIIPDIHISYLPSSFIETEKVSENDYISSSEDLKSKEEEKEKEIKEPYKKIKIIHKVKKSPSKQLLNVLTKIDENKEIIKIRRLFNKWKYLKDRRIKGKHLLFNVFLRKDSIPQFNMEGADEKDILSQCFNIWMYRTLKDSKIKNVYLMKEIRSKGKSSSHSLSLSNSGSKKVLLPNLERPAYYNKLFNVVIKHINRDGKFNTENMLRDYFNRWRKTVKEQKEIEIRLRHRSRNEINSFDGIINPYDSDKITYNPLLEDETHIEEPNIQITQPDTVVKEIIPRIRVNEKIRLLVSLNQKLRIIFNKWKNLNKKEDKKEEGILILRKLSRRSSIMNKLKPSEIRKRNHTIANATEIRKQSRIDIDELFRKSYPSSFTNIKKKAGREYFKKLFDNKLKNQIPDFTKQMKLYKKVPKAIKYLRLYLLKNYFKDFIKCLLSKDKKLVKMLNKFNDKKDLPSLKKIAASFIQLYYRKHLEKRNKKFRIKQLSKLFCNLDDDRIIELLYTRKWRYRAKKDKENKINLRKSMKDIFNKSVGKKIIDELSVITEKYADYINIKTLADSYKKIFAKRLFNSLRLKFILSKYIVDDDTEFKKKYVRSNMMRKWNEKCKILRRKRNAFMRIKRVLKIHSKKVLIITFKLKKLKLYLLSYALMRRDSSHVNSELPKGNKK